MSGKTKKILFGIFFFVSFLLVFPTPTLASNTYYVATNGSDSYPGTETEPFLTISHGVTVLTPGDTLYVKNGTYTESLDDEIPSGTSWSNPVTVAAYPGHTPVLRPGTITRVLNFSTAGGADSYIIIDGFILDGANVTSDNVKINGGHHIRIKNSEVKNAPQQGILVSTSLGDASYNEFINLIIHDNGTDLDLDHGIYISGGDNILVENVTSYNSTGVGLTTNGDNNIFRGNTTYNNNHFGIRIVGPSSGNLIYNNIAYGNVTNFRGGIQIGGSASTNAKIYNNTVYGNYRGIVIEDNSATGTVISNNIVASNTNYGIDVAISAASNTTISNNLIVDNGINSIHDLGTNTTKTTNYIAQNYISGFVNAVSHNFTLLSTSSAIDRGLTFVEVATDFGGTNRPRGSTYDIGAFEYISPTPTSAPSLVPASSSISASGPYSPTVKLTQTATGQTSVGAGSLETATLTFSGTASPYANIKIRIVSSDGKVIPGTTTVDETGNWFWNPPPNLAPGEYQATFIAQDKKGNIGTTTVDFTINEKGESQVTQVTQEETITTNFEGLFARIITSIKNLLSNFLK